MSDGAVVYHDGGFPPATLGWESLVPYIGPASASVARYDGILSVIPNVEILLSPLSTQEAVLSSRIEGTQATMGEVLEYEARGGTGEFSPERVADIREILNYRNAMNYAIDALKTIPLCQRLIKDTHKVLLDSVRGKNKSPGEYRRVPNWIGPAGCTIETARYVPISADKLPDTMSRWEKYLHGETADRLIQLAILHAEFEALHPFLDGNGRMGRMMIPLFMYQSGLIKTPMFYISAYFETHRDEYYERLLAVSRDNDWTGWCVFFLKAVQLQAEENQKKALAILKLYDEMKIKIVELTHSQYSIHTLDWIFKRPIFRTSDFMEESGITRPTAKRILGLLKADGILKVAIEGRGRSTALLIYPALLNIGEGYEAF